MLLNFSNPLRGGYLVKPHSMEFWQGQTNRLHDRIVFTKKKVGEKLGEFQREAADGWLYQRLSPWELSAVVVFTWNKNIWKVELETVG